MQEDETNCSMGTRVGWHSATKRGLYGVGEISACLGKTRITGKLGETRITGKLAETRATG